MQNNVIKQIFRFLHLELYLTFHDFKIHYKIRKSFRLIDTGIGGNNMAKFIWTL